MRALDYILDGLERALQLERELGVKAVECDRALLAECVEAPRPAPAAAAPTAPTARPTALVVPPPPAAPEPPGRTRFDFVFLHDRPLSPKGVEMMAKIITAMKRTAETAPIVVASPVPAAGMYIVLGGNALKRYFPGMRGAPGQWLKTESGVPVLVTNSPEYILRFGEVTPAVKKIKEDMWRSLKTVMQRLGS